VLCIWSIKNNRSDPHADQVHRCNQDHFSNEFVRLYAGPKIFWFWQDPTQKSSGIFRPEFFRKKLEQHKKFMSEINFCVLVVHLLVGELSEYRHAI
jgi:hypothetical protein